MVIYTRLEKFYQVLLNGTHQSSHQVLLEAEEQLKLNPTGHIGIPNRSEKFVKFMVERMAKILSKAG